jgi:hypothetical protein
VSFVFHSSLRFENSTLRQIRDVILLYDPAAPYISLKQCLLPLFCRVISVLRTFVGFLLNNSLFFFLFLYFRHFASLEVGYSSFARRKSGFSRVSLQFQCELVQSHRLLALAVPILVLHLFGPFVGKCLVSFFRRVDTQDVK